MFLFQQFSGKELPIRFLSWPRQKKLELSTTPKILEELSEVLQREKFKPFFQQAKTTSEEVFEKILRLVKVYVPKEKIEVIKEDSFDNEFLACAWISQASFIVSGDKHLLKLKSFQGIPILRPREFLKRIQAN